MFIKGTYISWGNRVFLIKDIIGENYSLQYWNGELTDWIVTYPVLSVNNSAIDVTEHMFNPLFKVGDYIQHGPHQVYQVRNYFIGTSSSLPCYRSHIVVTEGTQDLGSIWYGMANDDSMFTKLTDFSIEPLFDIGDVISFSNPVESDVAVLQVIGIKGNLYKVVALEPGRVLNNTHNVYYLAKGDIVKIGIGEGNLLLKYLRTEDLPPDIPDNPNPPSQKSGFNMKWLIGIGSGVLVAGSLVWYLIKKKSIS